MLAASHVHWHPSCTKVGCKYVYNFFLYSGAPKPFGFGSSDMAIDETPSFKSDSFPKIRFQNRTSKMKIELCVKYLNRKLSLLCIFYIHWTVVPLVKPDTPSFAISVAQIKTALSNTIPSQFVLSFPIKVSKMLVSGFLWWFGSIPICTSLISVYIPHLAQFIITLGFSTSYFILFSSYSEFTVDKRTNYLKLLTPKQSSSNSRNKLTRQLYPVHKY